MDNLLTQLGVVGANVAVVLLFLRYLAAKDKTLERITKELGDKLDEVSRLLAELRNKL